MANKQEWAEWAVSGILLPKERESARQELLDHMEDHMEALLAAGFPDMRPNSRRWPPWATRRTPQSCCGWHTSRF